MRPFVSVVALVAVVAISCAEGSPRPTPSSRVLSGAALVSDPVEYRERPLSAAAGKDYFTETGLGDPYSAGLPYPILLAFMGAYPGDLGSDWRSFRAKFGALRREGSSDESEELPVGFHLTVDPNTGVPFVMNNCELCHAERLHLPGGDRFVDGLPNKRIRIHAYDAALTRIVKDDTLSVDRLLPLAEEAASSHHLVWPAQFQRVMVEATLRNMRDRARIRSAEVERLSQGLPGRVATIESFTMALGVAAGHALPVSETPGWAKIPDVRNVRYRDTLSWDAVGTGALPVLVVEADLSFGARPEWFVAHRHLGPSLFLYLHDFQRTLRFPGHIDAVLASRGRELFHEHCARCHGAYGGAGDVTYHERVVPLDVVGTDPARAHAVTAAFVSAANADPLTQGITHVAATHGYVPPPLLDVWARAPFGHVGQWPSLRVMATKPEARPARFVVRPDAQYDLDAVGVAVGPVDSTTPGPGEYLYHGHAPGLSVLGHPFLADLGPDAAAVIEYLKGL